MQPAVYILTSQRNGTLYTGLTSDLAKRTWEHKKDFVAGFTKRYGVHILVYFELHVDIISIGESREADKREVVKLSATDQLDARHARE